MCDASVDEAGGVGGGEIVVSVTDPKGVASIYDAVAAMKAVDRDSFRLRKVLGGGGVGCVLRQSESIKESLAGICDGLAIAVQILGRCGGGEVGRRGAEGELKGDEVSVFVRRMAVTVGDVGVGGEEGAVSRSGGEVGRGVCKLEDAVEVVFRKEDVGRGGDIYLSMYLCMYLSFYIYRRGVRDLTAAVGVLVT
jgi:hypothetical protein